jgi:peptide deformylase
MQIVHYPHPSLRWKSSEVTRVDAKLRAVVKEMFTRMYAAQGIGLAANQVALPLRLFVMNPTGDPAQPDAELVFINPEIITRKGSNLAEEGCLSLPDLYAEVRRAEEITIEAFDLKGQGFEVTLDELPARVAQHEYDHIEGVLFVDRVSPAVEREIAPKLSDFNLHYRRRQESGEIASDEELRAELKSKVDLWTKGG